MMMTWKSFLEEESNKPYFQKILSSIKEEELKYKVFPLEEDRFNAFALTPFNKVKVIILGQDPYHANGQANGLAFSSYIDIPPSLRNIFKEIESDLSIKCHPSGDLRRWATQGVFLLNTSLTVRKGEANSHESIPWDLLTTKALILLDKDPRPKVFMLWGQKAKKVKPFIKNPSHLILEGAHPSPLSAYRGFFGGKYFSKANEFLANTGQGIIDWK